MLYRLTADALDDLDSLLCQIAEHSGWNLSMRIEEQVFAAFERLGENPGIGHLREDLIAQAIYFYYSEPYLIAYRRDTNPPIILAVIHGARDVAALLQERSL